MDSLSDLKKYLLDNDVQIKSSTGYSLVVGRDKWGMAHGVLYCNGEPVNRKEEKKFLMDYAAKRKGIVEVEEAPAPTRSRKWKGIANRKAAK